MRNFRWRISPARTFASSGPGAPAHGWPVLMAIVNVTPDSFSDGGSFDGPGAAVRHAMRCIADHLGTQAAAEFALGLPGSAGASDGTAAGRGYLRAMAIDVLLRAAPPLLPTDSRIEASLRDALEEARVTHGPDSDQALVCESSLARCLASMGAGRMPEARELAEHAAVVLRARHGERRGWIRPAESLADRLRGG